MRFDEYRRHDATALAGLIAKGDVSPREVLDVAIARAEQVNPAINAIVHKQYDQARRAVAAGPPNGPLKGVPYLIKDLGFFEKGEPATFGSSLFADFVADHDSAYVRRCKEAGLVFMGRSSSPEFDLSPNTEPRLYGSCRNPWNLAHSAGGSSGGAAAASSPASCRWRTPPTAAALFASRQPSAAFSGSSRRAAAFPWPRIPARAGAAFPSATS
jgi:Asp-tRNA(Asn)/Glu-tRNA(Gln) amidotransferase A subunit family amidase